VRLTVQKKALHQLFSKSLILLTLAALLNALSAPVVCAVGWCSLDAKEETCADCSCDEASMPPAKTDQGSSCPLAGVGICAGLHFLVENTIALAESPVAIWILDETASSCPLGYKNKLIRPPSSSC
jgi:hypothetical protein